jgi:Reverse transcriptase (RNA-dependent DNA polymerase)
MVLPKLILRLSDRIDATTPISNRWDGLRRRLSTRRCDLTLPLEHFPAHVLDEWFETEARPRLKGGCTLVRFADDAVMTFENFLDGKRVLDVVGKRFARYGLSLHPDKTRFVDFRH